MSKRIPRQGERSIRVSDDGCRREKEITTRGECFSGSAEHEESGKNSRQKDGSVLTRRTTRVLSLESGSSSGVGGRGRFGAWLESSPPPPALRLLIAIATASRGLQQEKQKQSTHQSDENGVHAFRVSSLGKTGLHTTAPVQDGTWMRGQKGFE